MKRFKGWIKNITDTITGIWMVLMVIRDMANNPLRWYGFYE
ncbi:hypothetical protein BMS3Abin15_00683 [bacterium BMS3Abin15]|nr:hypothetical protein BMS3Abin15_00683 [bacterium BMS3Abin15]